MYKLAVFSLFLGACACAAAQNESKGGNTAPEAYPLWDSSAPAPSANAAPFPRMITHVTVHRAQKGGYTFLHGPAIYAFHGEFFSSWANSLVDENSESETCQGRRSMDGGMTWGPVEIIAPGFPGEERHSHGAFFVWQDALYAPVCRFGLGEPIEGGFVGLSSELFVWRPETKDWASKGKWIDDFWPLETPKRMANGKWVQGGVDDHSQPVVAISQAEDPAGAWDTVKLLVEPPLSVLYAETTVLVNGNDLVAIIRPPTPEVALVSVSRDLGKTWSSVGPSNLPMAPSKPLSGTLSTGQHYLIYDWSDDAAAAEDWSKQRDSIVIAVSKPGAAAFSNLYRIRYGSAPAMRFPGKYKGGSWSYPNAFEYEGKLYVVYSVNKEDCELSIIPLSCLSGDASAEVEVQPVATDNVRAAQPITNQWDATEKMDLHTNEVIIQQAVEGRSYHHHSHVLAFDGQLYATFSSGYANEDDIGQEVWFTRSTDTGLTWDQPRCIVKPPMGQFAPCVCTATGLHAYREPDTGQAVLAAYYGQYEYSKEGLEENGQRKPKDAAHMNTRCMAIFSRDGGETWSEPAVMFENAIANISPQKLLSGRLVFPCGSMFPYTDDPTGLGGWQVRGLPGLPPGHVDDSAGFALMKETNPGRFGYCEGSMYQLPDGTIHMMLRTNQDHLAVTKSFDQGETWSEVQQTQFSDNGSRHQFGRLPDGRYFALSTPDPKNMWTRTPLVIALSKDGYVFDRHFIVGNAPDHPQRVSGLFKGGRYGYPYMAVVDDTVVVFYSVAKEDIAMCRFPLRLLAPKE